MSMSPIRYQQQINFSAPTALNTDTVGTDADTSQNAFIPRTANVLLDVKHTSDPAAGLLYTLYIRRQNLSRTRIGVTGDFLTTFNGQVRPNMPRGVNAGFLQWVEQQNAGALTAQNYLAIWQQPLTL